jgi:hypothetical protein
MKLEEAGAREDPRERLKRLRVELAARAVASAAALKAGAP